MKRLWNDWIEHWRSKAQTTNKDVIWRFTKTKASTLEARFYRHSAGNCRPAQWQNALPKSVWYKHAKSVGRTKCMTKTASKNLTKRISVCKQTTAVAVKFRPTGIYGERCHLWDIPERRVWTQENKQYVDERYSSMRWSDANRWSLYPSIALCESGRVSPSASSKYSLDRHWLAQASQSTPVSIFGLLRGWLSLKRNPHPQSFPWQSTNSSRCWRGCLSYSSNGLRLRPDWSAVYSPSQSQNLD